MELRVCAKYLFVSAVPMALARAWTTIPLAPVSLARFAASAITLFASADRLALNSSKYTRKRGNSELLVVGVCAFAAPTAANIDRRKIRRHKQEIILSLQFDFVSLNTLIGGGSLSPCVGYPCFGHPGLQQGVTHRKNDGSQKNANQAKGDEATDDAGQQQDERQMRPFANQQRAHDAVEGAEQDAPDQKKGSPAGRTAPIEPDHSWHQYRQGAELGNAQHKHDGRKHGGEGQACQCNSNTAEYRLAECRYDHPQCHTTDRLRRKTDRLLATFAGEPTSEAAHRGGGVLAVQVHDAGNDNRQKKLHKHDPEAAQRGDKPACYLAGIGRRLRNQRIDAASGKGFPESRRLIAEERNNGQPVRRRRQFERGERGCPSDDPIEIVGNRRDGEPERYHENDQQRQGHDRDRKSPPIP